MRRLPLPTPDAARRLTKRELIDSILKAARIIKRLEGKIAKLTTPLECGHPRSALERNVDRSGWHCETCLIEETKKMSRVPTYRGNYRPPFRRSGFRIIYRKGRRKS